MTGLLDVRGVVVTFPAPGAGPRRRRVHALSGVDLSMRRGQTHGLVGESGSGKSTLARCVLGLQRPDEGSVVFDGTEIVGLRGKALREVRRRIQPVFQDPLGSLDPRWTVGRSVRESLDAFGVGSALDRERRVKELLDLVGLSPDHADRHPSQLSGGQRQRVGIAAALASGPDLIVADEPVSALDVSVQAQILNLVSRLRRDLGVAVLFVSHDLGVVEHVSQEVSVMYLGRIVETGSREELFAEPVHPYTRALLDAIPVPEPDARLVHVPLPGDIPSPIDPPRGCRFHPRCSLRVDACSRERPPLRPVTAAHHVACPVALQARSQAGTAPVEH
ncbi:ABC transporter ATP-binding protein [Microbispora sp. RL4-1S]|uniref:ABC transporter ATP-binding protein n=1 Tax=Microbispora oryzae TaxID=2806554 RepID=A0A941ALX9_9ACTN|nr:ABC transporter ATP-binding protein [Microbispora oryzae]MBP2707742.1 ABC transporter ATP-binding protein [Microbispora oryzae]